MNLGIVSDCFHIPVPDLMCGHREQMVYRIRNCSVVFRTLADLPCRPSARLMIFAHSVIPRSQVYLTKATDHLV